MPPSQSLYFRIVTALASAALISAAYVGVNSFAPKDFIPGTIVHVEKSSSLGTTATILAKDHVIKSAFFFKVLATLRGARHGIAAGDYLFKTAPFSWTVAGRLVRGDQGLDPIKVTLPEGLTVHAMGDVLAKNIKGFDEKTFLSLAHLDRVASSSEGYLFPDTYLFYPNVTAQKVFSTLRDTFNQKIKILDVPTRTIPKTHSVKDVVTLASIVEKEASVMSDRRIVAGILWKRLAAGRALQVDPPFAYILGKSSDELTLQDLQVDSPYNTYKNKGLPPTPIDNPGIEAMTAAISPTETAYWFYLSDKKGNMHYAVTYDGHLANR